jgi:hypothetical protein
VDRTSYDPRRRKFRQERFLQSRQANPLGRGESYDPADRQQHMIFSTVKRPAAVFRTTR